jgi:hypothetical protein
MDILSDMVSTRSTDDFLDFRLLDISFLSICRGSESSMRRRKVFCSSEKLNTCRRNSNTRTWDDFYVRASGAAQKTDIYSTRVQVSKLNRVQHYDEPIWVSTAFCFLLSGIAFDRMSCLNRRRHWVALRPRSSGVVRTAQTQTCFGPRIQSC